MSTLHGLAQVLLLGNNGDLWAPLAAKLARGLLVCVTHMKPHHQTGHQDRQDDGCQLAWHRQDGVATHTLPKDLVAAAAGQKCDAFWHHLCIVGILLAAEPCRPAPDER